jgi:Transposase IS116/IS110/IS902 family
MLLIAAGDHPERLRSDAAWAHLRATAPIPASSGKVTRHRLNSDGDRQANHALWRIVITRMSSHPATRAYVARRTKEGLSKKEIIAASSVTPPARCISPPARSRPLTQAPGAAWPSNRLNVQEMTYFIGFSPRFAVTIRESSAGGWCLSRDLSWPSG